MLAHDPVQDRVLGGARAIRVDRTPLPAVRLRRARLHRLSIASRTP
jgi:hypothetical protein